MGKKLFSKENRKRGKKEQGTDGIKKNSKVVDLNLIICTIA